MNALAWAGVFAVLVIFFLALRWRIAARSRKAEAEHERADPHGTKRRLDTALNELRDLREALTPDERIRIERRRADSPGLQGRPERRKQKPGTRH